MRRTLPTLALAVSLMVATPAVRADTDSTDKDKYDKILRELQKMSLELSDVRTMAVQVQANTRDVQDLKRRMDSLEQAFERYSAGKTRMSSSYTPNEPPPGTPAAPTAAIRIQNRYSIPATVYINGQAYQVPAYETRRILGLPAGPFTYEVQAEGYGVIQPAVSRAVSANETFSIFINPPAQAEAPLLMLP